MYDGLIIFMRMSLLINRLIPYFYLTQNTCVYTKMVAVAKQIEIPHR